MEKGGTDNWSTGQFFFDLFLTHKGVISAEVPDYLGFIFVDVLGLAKPEAAKIIR